MEKRNYRKSAKRQKLGPTMQKVLVLLEAGLAFGLTQKPSLHFRVHKEIAKEWKEIDQRALREAIRKLYQSKLIDARERRDGVVTIILEEAGKKKALEYNVEKMRIKKPVSWNGKWHVVISDIPEYKKKARDAFSAKLKRIGLFPLQKSVFISPYPCRDEIDFLIELFDLRPFVRYLVVKEIDNDLHLRKQFDLV